MAFFTQKRILNLIPRVSAPVTIHVSQGDVGTDVEFSLLKGDERFYAVSGMSATVHGVRNDGANFGPFICTLNSDKVSFSVRSEMTALKGVALAEIVIVDNGGNKVGSANFGIMVEESTFPLGVTYNNDVSIYESILSYVQILQARVESIVAPTGEAPNPAEILDARLGADGVVYNTLGEAIRAQDERTTTEITDARLGADDVVYNTLGEAIRAQVSNLKNDLTDISNESFKTIPINYQTGKYYSTSTLSIIENNDVDSKYAVIDLSNYIGMVAVVKSDGRYSDTRKIAMGNSNKEMPLRWGISQEILYNSTFKTLVYPITQNYHHLYVSFSTSANKPPIVKIAKGQNVLGFINSISGGYLTSRGVESSDYTDRWRTKFIPCPGDVAITYAGETNNANVGAICFYDEAKNFISSLSNVGSINTLYTAITPKKTKYVRLSSGEGKLLYLDIPIANLFEHYDRETTCYVSSTSGNDANSGISRDDAFATIQKAIDSGYKNILVREGTYAPFTANGINDVKIQLDQYYTVFVEQTDVDHPYVIIRGGTTGILLENCNNWTFDSILITDSTQYGLRAVRCDGLVMNDCVAHDIARTGNLVGAGFSFVNVNGYFYNCGAYNIGRYDTALGVDHNDGFNIHGVGTTNFINCWGYNCQDDGISHHDACTGLIDGGEWYNCGKGGVASPTHGAVIDVRNIYSHDNVFGIYSAAEYDYHRGKSPLFYNCVMLDNTYDLSYRNQSNKAILYNCKYSTVLGDTNDHIIVIS